MRQSQIARPPKAVSRPKVLVVDDSAAQLALLRVVLQRTGIEVAAARSAEEALALCATPEGADIRMILSDWQMPGLDGPDFCRAFRALDRGSYAYFILMTSETDRSVKAEGLEAGADDFITRPLDMSELRARIRAGRRILDMQEELEHRNHEIRTTLTELQELHDAMDRDLREARRLQQGFLPPSHHRVGASSLSLRLLACNQVGGDLVGYFDLPQAGIALFSIDVSGHGIASALLTGRLSGLFSRDNLRRNIAFNPDGTVVSPEVVMSRLNDFMLHEMSSDIYFTAVLAYVDGATGRVRFCQAGHPHPLVRRHCGSVEAVGHGGPPVGLLEGATFELETCDLREGDSFLTYSDGLTECADTWGEALEEKGLMSLLQGAGSDTEAAVESIERGLEDHVGFAGYDDDVSMILFRFGAAPDSALAA